MRGYGDTGYLKNNNKLKDKSLQFILVYFT